jgi:hypothetical protein
MRTYQLIRGPERRELEAQSDIIWPTTGTPNSTEVPEDRCFRMIGSQSTSVLEIAIDVMNWEVYGQVASRPPDEPASTT